MPVTSAAKTKSEGDHRAPAHHPLRNFALARFGDDVGLAQLSQSFLVGVRSDAAPPVDSRDVRFRARSATPSQKDLHD